MRAQPTGRMPVILTAGTAAPRLQNENHSDR